MWRFELDWTQFGCNGRGDNNTGTPHEEGPHAHPDQGRDSRPDIRPFLWELPPLRSGD